MLDVVLTDQDYTPSEGWQPWADDLDAELDVTPYAELRKTWQPPLPGTSKAVLGRGSVTAPTMVSLADEWPELAAVAAVAWATTHGNEWETAFNAKQSKILRTYTEARRWLRAGLSLGRFRGRG